MPHSSGGGSSSSGGHSGGSSFSHSSSRPGSNGYSGDSEYAGPVIHDRPFNGARYMYRSHHWHNYYINYTDTKMDPEKEAKKARTCLIKTVFWILLACLICFTPGGFIYPAINCYSLYGGVISAPRVDDQANLCGDTTELIAEMQKFQDTTGISTLVVTSDTVPSYPYKVAYDEYVSRFNNDETRWLLYYCEKDGTWAWEGIIGDNTDISLSRSNQDNFTSTVQQALDSGASPEDAFCAGFKYLNETIKNPLWKNIIVGYNQDSLIIRGISTVFVSFFVLVNMLNFKQHRQFVDAEETILGETF